MVAFDIHVYLIAHTADYIMAFVPAEVVTIIKYTARKYKTVIKLSRNLRTADVSHILDVVQITVQYL